MESNKTKSRADEVFDQMKTAILYSHPNFMPGDFLNENKLADFYKVSKTPVREALSRLRFDNLIEVIPYKGYIVNNLSYNDLVDLFQLRLILEVSAAELAVEKMTSEELKKLEDLTNLSTIINEEEELSLQFRKINLEFHRLIAEASGNKWLAEMIKQVVEQMQRAQFHKISESMLETLFNDHKEILEAFKQRDVEQVKSVMKKQIDQAKSRVFK
jgi:DNA-binding GntR family transcriptional regulator